MSGKKNSTVTKINLKDCNTLDLITYYFKLRQRYKEGDKDVIGELLKTRKVLEGLNDEFIYMLLD